MKTEKGYIVSFGLGGHYISGENWMLSGYESPESFVDQIKTGHYEKYDLAGALVIDLRAVVEKKPALAFLAPMVSVKLTGEQVDRIKKETIDESLMCKAMMTDTGNQYGTLLKMQSISKEPGPLDMISPEGLVKWWKDRGARTGKLNGNIIDWDINTMSEDELAKDGLL
ncbi:MAG: hypothetical protein WC476_11715 [Phycisphaerae bacterium]|jgi:hypothetical protein